MSAQSTFIQRTTAAALLLLAACYLPPDPD